MRPNIFNFLQIISALAFLLAVFFFLIILFNAAPFTSIKLVAVWLGGNAFNAVALRRARLVYGDGVGKPSNQQLYL